MASLSHAPVAGSIAQVRPKETATKATCPGLPIKAARMLLALAVVVQARTVCGPMLLGVQVKGATMSMSTPNWVFKADASTPQSVAVSPPE